jgi:seryl-tRNA synthetase
MSATKGRKHVIALDPPLDADRVDELARRLYYVSDRIVDFTLEPAGAPVARVVLHTDTPVTTESLAQGVRAVIADEVSAQRLREPKLVWERPSARLLAADPFEELLASGAAFEAGEGQVALGEPVLSLLDRLDRAVREIAVRSFGASEYRYPTLIPTSAMRRTGYLGSFPQYLMVVTRLHGELDSYRDFAAETASAPHETPIPLTRCRDADYCLPPTMCFHTYHQLRDAALREPQFVVTSRGKSFRYESRYRRTLERLWDFTIRETVFLGPRDFVDDGRQRFMQETIALVERLGLGGRCEVANDPFFAGAETAARILSQRLLELKYELRLDVGEGRTIAVGSFNFHERFFGQAFGITVDGEPVDTACVGIGLERLVYAFLCRHGLDPAEWPDEALPRAGGDG